MVAKWYLKFPGKFKNVQCDEFIIMPNHFHAVIWNVGADLCVCPNPDNDKGEHTGSPLPTIVQWFKTMTTNEYIRGVTENGWASFDGKLWQRNYGACPERSRRERVLRNEDELNRIREYIIYNP